jgi:hypothetical protein
MPVQPKYSSEGWSLTDRRYDGRSTMRDRFDWARPLAFVTGLVKQDLLLRNEYLIAENRILRGHLSMRLRLADPVGLTLPEIAKRLGRKALKDVAQVAPVQCAVTGQSCH